MGLDIIGFSRMQIAKRRRGPQSVSLAALRSTKTTRDRNQKIRKKKFDKLWCGLSFL